MGFLQGRVSYERFAVSGHDGHPFAEKELATLERYAAGQGRMEAEGIEIGFVGGTHILDVQFGLEKNLVNDCLHCGLRIDTTRPPGDLLRAYQEMELAALVADNPSGYPTKQQRLQARQAADERIQQEANDGRFRKMKQIPILWDSRQNLIYFGSGSQNAIERFLSLFKDAFGVTLARITGGSLAHQEAEKRGQARALEDLSPAIFAGPERTLTVAWVANQFGSRDFLGNEFFLWLWWLLDQKADTVKLSDNSTVTCMMTRTLTLECPLSETGRETISSEAPVQLPEAKRAVLAGKLPRKSGLILVRHDEQYALTLQAETLAVSGAALPKLESDSPEREREDRIDQIRHLSETVDLLFDAFCQRRLASDWAGDLRAIRKWLEVDE